MQTKDIIKYGILAFGGLLLLKSIGGVKGLSNIFSGIGGIFGAGGGGAPSNVTQSTVEDILTQTQETEQVYESLTPEGQQLAENLQSIDIAEQQSEQTFASGYLDFMAGATSYIPVVGDILGAISGKKEQIIDTAQKEAQLQYYHDRANKQQKAEIEQQIQDNPLIQQTQKWVESIALMRGH